MKSLTLPILLLVGLLNYVQAMYFFLDGTVPRCFLEDLPANTVVTGNFHTETLNSNTNSYQVDSQVKITVEVTKVADGSSLTHSTPGHEGKFTFTSNDYGQYRICFSSSKSGTSWFTTTQTKFFLDIFVGSDAIDDPNGKDQISSLYDQFRITNSWLKAVVADQSYQNIKETQYEKNISKVKGSILFWIFVQAILIGGTCYWQLTHLKRFFVSKKLV